MKIDKLKEFKSIAILGYGKEGKSTEDFLLRLGINKNHITILDKNDISSLNGSKIISGDKYLDDLDIYDVIFKSPGISPYNKKILPVKDKLTSQTEVFFSNYNGRTIGITATKGKSTTSTLVYKALELSKLHIKIVGNIGNPVLDEIDLLHDDLYDYVIYELSSYMLETCTPNCDIAVLGNIYTCHLDWHNDSFQIYEQAKLNIFEKSQCKIISQDFSYYGQDIDNIFYFGRGSNYSYDEDFFYKGEQKLFNTQGILLMGDHNKKNISSVIAVLDRVSIISDINLNLLVDSLKNILENFSGLPHRLEKIGTYKGVTFIDDGISTTPESTVEAIKTFGSKIGTLILGGSDYGFTDESYKLIRNIINVYGIKNIVLFPDTGLKIMNLNKNNFTINTQKNINIDNHLLNIYYTDSMELAVKYGYKNTENGKICILSSASPSFSLWTGYLEKCSEFKKYIEGNK